MIKIIRQAGEVRDRILLKWNEMTRKRLNEEEKRQSIRNDKLLERSVMNHHIFLIFSHKNKKIDEQMKK